MAHMEHRKRKKEIVEQIMDVDVPWSFDDTNEESLLGDFHLDKAKLQSMLSKKALKEKTVRVVTMPVQIHRNRQRLVAFLREFFEPSYAKFHVAYIFLTSFFGGLLLYTLENGSQQTPYLSMINAMFISTSAVCVTGLATADVSQMTYQSQVLIMVLFQMGSTVMGTMATVLIRRYYFRKRWPHVVDPNLRRAVQAEEAAIVLADKEAEGEGLDEEERARIKKEVKERMAKHEDALRRQVEYAALGKLLYLIFFYIVILYIWAFTTLAIYMSYSPFAQQVLEEQSAIAYGPIDPVFFALFHTISAFNNAGFSLFQSNMVPLAQSRVVLLVLSVLIACGNTAFPVFMRFIIFCCRRLSRKPAPYKILLVRPRSLYTHLFPSTETRQLALTWIATTLFQLICFLSLNGSLFDSVPLSDYLLTAWFNVVCTRTAGFNSTDLAALHNGMLVVLAVMMYASSYPFTLTLHDSISAPDRPFMDQEDEIASMVERDVDGMRLKKRKKRGSFTKSLMRAVSFHGKSMLQKHAFWLFTVWFLIVSIEGSQPQSDDEIFRIMFEIASSYGTVGLSLGWAGGPTSFSASLLPFSKFLMMTVMFIGRHRDLPSSLDPSISLFREDGKPADTGNEVVNSPVPKEQGVELEMSPVEEDSSSSSNNAGNNNNNNNNNSGGGESTYANGQGEVEEVAVEEEEEEEEKEKKTNVTGENGNVNNNNSHHNSSNGTTIDHNIVPSPSAAEL